MSQWFNDALARAEAVEDWLVPRRRHALQLLKETPWPTRKTEAWKYTSVRPLADLNLAYGAKSAVSGLEVIPGLESIDLQIVNGRLNSLPAQESLPAGLSIKSLDDDSQSWLAQEFSTVKPERHLFGLVNDVLATEGVIIDVEPGVQINQPVRLVSQMTEGCESHFRVFVRLAKGASATVIEQFTGCETSFLTTVAEFDLAAKARLEHYRFALQTDVALSVGGDHFRLGQEAYLNSTVVGFGSKLSRVDVDIEHAGENARAELNAIYLLDGDELFDLHSTIEHAVPSCVTEEKVRGIVAGTSKAVFNGRIHIHRDAQKTLAELNNLNLLMSRDAQINTKPELEIYADDVRCAHGATVAELDKKSLYYLQSRGISRTEAQVMLSFGFINELVNEMPNGVLAEWLRPRLRERFEKMKVQ